MIDYFALALTHALLVIALLRLIKRDDVDREEFAHHPHEDDTSVDEVELRPGTRAAIRAKQRAKHGEKKNGRSNRRA